MIRRVMQCEACGKQVDLSLEIDMSHYYGDTPETWFTLVEGNPRANAPWHFCTDACLHRWLLARLSKAMEKDKS